jgi:transcriptional regulator of arginine metabolism
MSGRTTRLDVIKNIISSKEIGNQEELLFVLKKEGYNITQATLSRDLKSIKVAKASSPYGKSVYILPENTRYKRVRDGVSVDVAEFSEGFVSVSFSANIVVVKTNPGYASRMAYNIDNADIDVVLGTIAGDDTVMLVLSEGVTREEAKIALSPYIPIGD